MHAETQDHHSTQSWQLIVCGPSAAIRHSAGDFGDGEAHDAVFASDLTEAIEIAKRRSRHIVVAGQESVSNIDLDELRTQLLINPGVLVLVLLSDMDDEDIHTLLRCGVSGVLGDFTSEAFRRAVRSILAGEIWASRKLLSGTLRSMRTYTNDSRFTRREVAILRGIAAGKDNRQIAEELYITRDTVRWHLRSAYSKLGIHNRRAITDVLNRLPAGSHESESELLN